MIRFLVRHQFLFEIGAGVTSKMLGIVNMSLLLVAAGEPLRARLGFSSSGAMIGAAVGFYVFGTWGLGCILEQFKYMERLTDEGNRRNAALRRILEGGA